MSARKVLLLAAPVAAVVSALYGALYWLASVLDGLPDEFGGEA